MTAAIVTGASGGIGRATAATLAPDHDVLVHYHSNREGAEATAAAVEDAGGTATLYGCDISDPAAGVDLVDAAVDAFGRLDVLVNNASIFLEKDLESMENSEIDQTIAVNLLGTIYVTRAALPHLRERDAARVVNVASTAGTRGSPTDPTYGASKGGVVGFTRSVAKMHTADGVFANAVAPGPTDTPMFREERRDAVREASPLGRLVSPEEVAAAIRFFATASAISGRVLTVNGGWTL